MHDAKGWQQDLLSFIRPDEPVGALIYFVLFVVAASMLTRGLRAAVHAALSKEAHVDRTAINFMQQIGTVLIWLMTIILYAHLIPQLRAVGTALLAGAGVASVVIGLAAQSTLGNLVAGISMTIYRPFRLGDILQVGTPTGTEIGTVDRISLGYTTLRVQDGDSWCSPIALLQAKWPQPEPRHRALAGNHHHSRKPRCGYRGGSRLAIKAAAEVIGGAVRGCFVTKVDATEAQLELRFQAADALSRDAQRARVMLSLDRQFTADHPASPATQRPTFS